MFSPGRVRQAAALADLASAATQATTELVRDTHASIARTTFAAVARVAPLRAPLRLVEAVERGIAGVVYGSIGALADGAEVVAALTMRRLEADEVSARRRADNGGASGGARAAIGALNGAVGDLLARRGNPLATAMTLRHRGRRISAADLVTWQRHAEGGPLRICLFVHGLGCTESVWLPKREVASREGLAHDGEGGCDDERSVDYGAQLARELGYRPLYLRYNSGLSLDDNARALALLLEELHAAASAGPCELVLVGHSMGGLLAVAAARAGRAAGHDWPGSLAHVICLGTPHGAAPLARAAEAASRALAGLALPGVEVPARLLALRSAGLRDLAHAWPTHGTHREHHLAATVTADPLHPLGRLLGDTIVGVRSALAGAASTATEGGVSHLGLTRDARVYARIRGWLSGS